MNSQVIEQYSKIRSLTESLCQPLEIEDYGLQAMADTSPVKWHLAHTSWFFETFVLKTYETSFQHFNSKYEYLFNSYYNGIGEQFPRPQRGLISRPTVKEIYQYRNNIDDRMRQLFISDQQNMASILELTRLGINHEQQHQELILTDLLYNFHQNPMLPQYQKPIDNAKRSPLRFDWVEQESALVEIGLKNSHRNFAFDNEFPQHQVFLNPYKVANRLTTNGEFLEFIKAKGYQTLIIGLVMAGLRLKPINGLPPCIGSKKMEFGISTV